MAFVGPDEANFRHSLDDFSKNEDMLILRNESRSERDVDNGVMLVEKSLNIFVKLLHFFSRVRKDWVDSLNISWLLAWGDHAFDTRVQENGFVASV